MKVELSKEERIKRLVELRGELEKRVEEARAQLKGLEDLLELVDLTLIETGFKRLEVPKPIPIEYKAVVPVRTAAGEPLADLYIGADFLRVVMAKDKEFNVNTPPFTHFLIDRILSKMRDKDLKAVEMGELEPERILSFEIIRDGDILKELIVRNVSEERVRELKSSIRWTLERMYEKELKVARSK